MSSLSFISGSTVYERKLPVALPMADPAYGVLGSVVKLNGQASTDPEVLPGKSGSDATTIAGGSSIASPTGSFTGADIGRVIRLDGLDAGLYKIASILSITSVTVEHLNGGGVFFIGDSNRGWAIDDTLTYAWRFITVPVGSRVAVEGFRVLEPDLSLVSFSPDIVGEYIVGLVVSNGVLSSVEATTRISIRAILVPHGRGLVPDGKFIWSYIRDVWQEVANKEVFETFWSALVQICGAELLKLYQSDFNKSIRDIQDLYQRRWMAYEPRLDIVEADCTFFLGNSCAGAGGSTANLALNGQAIIISDGEILVVRGSVLPDTLGSTFRITADSMAPGNVGEYPVHGTNIDGSGYLIALDPPTVVGPDPLPGRILSGLQWFFDFQSTTWSLTLVPKMDYALGMSEAPPPPDWLVRLYAGIVGTSGASLINVGDIIYYPAGLNAGLYRVVDKSGSFVIVDHAPPGAAEIGGTPASVYRPVEFSLTPATPLLATSSSFSVPYSAGCAINELATGRLITVGGQSYTVLRAFLDNNQLVPTVIIVTDGGTVLVGQIGLNWRVANTLVSTSQNFEELGVSVGDFFEIDITNDNANLLSKVKAQVVGVDRFRLSFVLTTGTIQAGVVPAVSNENYLTLAKDFGISGVTVNQDGSLSFSGSAAAIIGVLNSSLFQRTYWNKALSSSTDINILGGVFHIHPKFILRNSRIPVDNELRSVPVLQDWIVQPTVVEHDSKFFQVRNELEYEIQRAPVSLIENSDFLVDNEIAFSGKMTFATGTDLLMVETGHFVSRGLKNGDIIEIEDPSTLADTYYVVAVLSNDTLRLNKPIPPYVLGTDVTARLIIRRKSTGRFIRVVPGVFTAAQPAPARLWAEVSLFDNRPSIEDNFGILVGLTSADLEAVSTDINYRQAVSGLMFAYTRGSAVNKIRLGAQILLGLPFAEHRGIIRSIENDYRLDDQGNPSLGRLLIEDIDSAGKALGTLRVYTFPIDPVSDLAGLDVNPATKQLYVVGDTVEAFAALSKGVEVSDYLTKPETSVNGATLLRQFHTAHLRANDSIFDIKELGLLSSFLKRITPSYIALVISTASEFADNVIVLDASTRKLGSDNNTPFIDQVALRIPTVPKYDLRTMGGTRPGFWDIGPSWVRVTGENNLSTTYPAFDAVLSGGGFVTPASGEGPVVRAGDLLVIPSGLNAGIYPVTVVTNTTLTVSGLPLSGFQTATQSFFVLRTPSGEVRRGVADSDGAGLITLEVGLHADGVAVGDILITEDGFKTVITDVGPHAATYDGLGNVITSLSAGTLRSLPALPVFTGKNYRIYRESFVESPYDADTGVLHSTGTAYDTFNNPYLQQLLQVGDEVQVQDSVLSRLTVLDPANLVFTPVLAVGSYTVKICKRVSAEGPISWDHAARFAPQDVVDIALWESQSIASCTGGSPIVAINEERLSASPDPAFPSQPASLSLVKPGDLLVLLSGANSLVDVGYGAGVYPIKAVSSPNLTVTTNLSNGGTAAWKIVRRR